VGGTGITKMVRNQKGAAAAVDRSYSLRGRESKNRAGRRRPKVEVVPSNITDEEGFSDRKNRLGWDREKKGPMREGCCDLKKISKNSLRKATTSKRNREWKSKNT